MLRIMPAHLNFGGKDMAHHEGFGKRRIVQPTRRSFGQILKRAFETLGSGDWD